MIGLCSWVGGAYAYAGPFVVGYRSHFEHWGWWGKALYIGHVYILLVVS